VTDLYPDFLSRLGESGCDAWTLARIAGHSESRFPRDMFILPKTLSSLPCLAWVGTNFGTMSIHLNWK